MQLSDSSGSQLAPQWSAQLLHLTALLSDDPVHAQAWRWRLRIKLLRFLLARYGNNPSLQRHQSSVHRPLRMRQMRFPNLGKAPRSRKTIRETLDRIAEVNEFVRQSVERRQARW